MKTIVKIIDDLMVSITFAEPGEYKTAIAMVGNGETADVNVSSDTETAKVIC
ncbi:MAG: hypothetical protein HQL09_01525 [Nitrospirae bacterium]|nr:hypothetical protein [Nitrospirota bacterium]